MSSRDVVPAGISKGNPYRLVPGKAYTAECIRQLAQDAKDWEYHRRRRVLTTTDGSGEPIPVGTNTATYGENANWWPPSVRQGKQIGAHSIGHRQVEDAVERIIRRSVAYALGEEE